MRLLKWGPASSKTAHSRDPCRSRVKRSLYQRAKGYSYDAVKIFMPAGADKPVYAPYVEHVSPDELTGPGAPYVHAHARVQSQSEKP